MNVFFQWLMQEWSVKKGRDPCTKEIIGMYRQKLITQKVLLINGVIITNNGILPLYNIYSSLNQY